MTPQAINVRILLVDDQPERLLAYEAILSDLGHELVRASSGVEALDKLMRQEFAVILLDVSMPGMDGFETAALIHGHPRFEKTPIIFVTGLHVTDMDRLKGYQVGAVDYVFVPVVPDILRGKVSVLVELYTQRKALQAANVELMRANLELAAANTTLRSERTRDLEAANEALAKTNGILQAEILERQRLQDALVAADKRKDEFLAIMAHELRNPLAPILNAVRLMQIHSIDDPEIVRCRDMIERQTEHLSHLVEDLLDMSRITQDKIVLHRETLLLDSIVERAIETTRPLIDGRRHSLSVTMPQEPVAVIGDATRLSQIIGNLLNNAAKFTEVGGELSVSVTCEEDEAGRSIAVLSVRDSGVGIAPQVLPHVFDLFSQAQPALDRHHSGLGIGLALVRRLVDLHGGTVAAASEGPGKGSTFFVRLPICADASYPVPPRSRLSLPSRSSTRNILIADDNVDSAESLAMLLRTLGHDVVTAHDGMGAMALAGSSRPEVMLLDLGMPDVDGCSVARWVRQQEWGRSVLIVAVTGWGSEKTRERTRNAGFDAHFVKPIEVSQLLDLITRRGNSAGITSNEMES